MRHSAGHKGASAGTTDRDLITDLECDLAAQNIGDFVAVVMDMKIGHRISGCHLLKHHDALGDFAGYLERSRSARGHLPDRATPCRHDQMVDLHCFPPCLALRCSWRHFYSISA